MEERHEEDSILEYARMLAGLIEGKRKKLENANFVARAPADVVAKEREQLAEMEERLASLAAMADDLRRQS